MVHIDTTKPDRVLNPGTDLWEVIEAKEGKSSKGDAMLKLKLARVSDPQDHLFENIMLAGAGWGIGKKKLGALVPAGFKGDLDPLDLIGRRLWVSTGVETFEGQDRLRVMINDLKYAGLQPAEMVPEGCSLPADTPPF